MTTAIAFIVGAIVGAVINFGFVLWCDWLDRVTRFDETIHGEHDR